jgi:hypothetical protein
MLGVNRCIAYISGPAKFGTNVSMAALPASRSLRSPPRRASLLGARRQTHWPAAPG